MASKEPIYQKAAQPTAARIEDLLARMTLEEKAAQLGSAWSFQIADGEKLDRKNAKFWMAEGLGQITRIGGANALSPDAMPRPPCLCLKITYPFARF